MGFLCAERENEGSLPCAVALAQWLLRQGQKGSRIARSSFLLFISAGLPSLKCVSWCLAPYLPSPVGVQILPFVIERFDGFGPQQVVWGWRAALGHKAGLGLRSCDWW